MEEKLQKSKEKSACSEKNSPFPEMISCPGCGRDLEVWTDEEEVLCRGCGHSFIRALPISLC